MEKIIEVKNLRKNFKVYKKETGVKGSFKNLFKRETFLKGAVNNISFDIKKGEFVGFIGPNGAGKTTTLKMLSGILYPTSGEAKCLGFTPWERKKDYQKQFGIVMGQKNQLWWDLPPLESYELTKEIYEISDQDFKKRLEELTALLDVKDVLKIQTRRLSLGQKMKCELINSLLHEPKVLFLDEPTIGLDVTSQGKIREFLREYNKIHKTTIILTSHYMRDIQRLCDRVIIIDSGKLIFDGPLKDLTKKYADKKRVEITFDDGIRHSKEEFLKFGKVIQEEESKIILEIGKGKLPESIANITSKYPINDLLISEVDIEEVISDIFNGSQKNKEKVLIGK